MINTVNQGNNGISKVILNLSDAMDTNDLLIDLVCGNEPDSISTNVFKNIGGNIFVISNRLNRPFSYINKLIKIIKENKYDCVHAHGNSNTLAFELLAAKLAGCKCRIAHSHNTTCKHKMIHKILSPLFLFTCNARLACGEEAGKWLFKNLPFTIINNGIDTKVFSYRQEKRNEIRKKLELDDKRILIGHVGSFNDFKNQDFLIDILANMPNVSLIMIGDGPRRKIVEQKVKDKRLEENVIFTGGVDNVNDYLSAIDIIVMPSFYEGLPLTLVEEQVAGLRCIVSDNITKEVNLTGNVMFLSLNDSVSQWVREIEKCLECKADRYCLSQKAIQQIINKGYDITHESIKLREYYLSNIQ